MRLLIVFIVVSLMGCLQADRANGPQNIETTNIRDQNLLAGATSSTNWPQEDVGSKRALVVVKFDSTLTMDFTDTTDIPIPLSGTLSIYLGGTIPAIDKPDSMKLNLGNRNSIVLSENEFKSELAAGKDTVLFSVLIRSDSMECLITGLMYSKGAHLFSRHPGGTLARFTYPISIPKYGFKAVPGDSLPKTVVSKAGKTGWCFYIPGSPYFFLPEVADIITVGPLPQGTYPIRLLVISEDIGNPKLQTLTIYEVKLVFSRKNPQWPTAVEIGEKISESTLKSSVSLRFDLN